MRQFCFLIIAIISMANVDPSGAVQMVKVDRHVNLHNDLVDEISNVCILEGVIKPGDAEAVRKFVGARKNGYTQLNCELVYLDHEGEILESYVTKRRDRKAALKFLRKSMKRHGQPHVIVTDKLRSYGAAMKVIGNSSNQETGCWLSNRAEDSHQPLRRRERAMQRFR
jgi:hypothetical protein